MKSILEILVENHDNLSLGFESYGLFDYNHLTDGIDEVKNELDHMAQEDCESLTYTIEVRERDFNSTKSGKVVSQEEYTSKPS